MALADALVAERWLEDGDGTYRLTPKGTQALSRLGIEVPSRPRQAPARMTAA